MRGRIFILCALLTACFDLLAASESPARSWLGVLLGDAVDGGVQVVALVPGGPAERAGLQRGDVILQANEVAVGDRERLDRLLAGFKPGDAVKLGILRSGEPMELHVELGEWRLRIRRQVEPGSPEVLSVLEDYRLKLDLDRDMMGCEIAEVTPDLLDHYGAPGDAGVLVTRVDPEQPAGRAGLKVGDILVRAAGREINRRIQLEEILLTREGEEPLQLQVIRNREPLTLELIGGEPSGKRVMVVSAAMVVPREIDPEGELSLAEDRLRAEIESLERRLQELRRILQELGGDSPEEPQD